MLRQVDRTQAAVLTRSQPLLAAGIGGFQRVEMRHRILAVGCIDEQQTGFAVVVGLVDDLVEQLAGLDLFVGLEGYTGGLEDPRRVPSILR